VRQTCVILAAFHTICSVPHLPTTTQYLAQTANQQNQIICFPKPRIQKPKTVRIAPAVEQGSLANITHRFLAQITSSLGACAKLQAAN
jgi:hypothetical protein